MATVLLVVIVLVLLASAAGIALFVRWLSRGWTVLAEESEHETTEGGAFWDRLRRLFGRGPPRLTYRRDEKGRFRRYRR